VIVGSIEQALAAGEEDSNYYSYSNLRETTCFEWVLNRSWIF
jgi:hypothetical protein